MPAFPISNNGAAMIAYARVLHHVYPVEVVLGEIVDRPIGRDPDRARPGGEGRHLEAGDDGRTGRREPRAEPLDRDRVAGRDDATSNQTSG